jgi:hypothetical protein
VSFRPDNFANAERALNSALVNTMAFRLVLNLRRYSMDGTTISTFDVYEMSSGPFYKSTPSSDARHARMIGGGLSPSVGNDVL